HRHEVLQVAGAQLPVNRVDARGANPDEDLARLWARTIDLVHDEHRGGTVLMKSHRPHRSLRCHQGLPPCPLARRASISIVTSDSSTRCFRPELSAQGGTAGVTLGPAADSDRFPG